MKNKLKKIPGHDLDDIKFNIKKKPKAKPKAKLKKEKKKKKREFKINYKKIIIVLIILAIVSLIAVKIANTRIKNIYIEGNSILSDQEIIDIAKIRNYPNTFKANSFKIEKRLEKNKYIKKAKVYKTNLFKTIHVVITENKPILIDTTGKILLSDGTKIDEKYNVPVLINEVPEKKLLKLLDVMNKLNDDVLIRISEISYVPNEVDDSLFMLKMTDENYVSINLKTFNKLNNYLDMVVTFNNKKGILHLDSGDYFSIITDQEE